MSTVEELRPLSFAVAYRMLGSVAEAEDVVQEALLRLHSTDAVANDEAFVTTVTTRLAIDVLRSARVRRETYVGDWLPEPLVEDAMVGRVEDEETISLAFLVLLERLTPEERAVLVLRDAFDYRFADIAGIVGKSEANCRQILSRARRRIGDERPRFDPDPAQRSALAARFLDAARDGDLDGLVALLAPDAVLVGDGGGKARSIPKPMAGGAQVARALAAFYRAGVDMGITLEPVLVNGQPGFRSRGPDGRLVNVVGLDVEDGRIRRVHSILNPDKLHHLGPLSDLALRPSLK
ncbi:RNA polymerase sigma-70 factor [Capillimicrobium parvum]|uniref:RNA polymerase sigma-70 factor n=1 Tax=Capillimicrobium parvum TaxID=2884022 RepID=UPI00216AC39F|nr:RNA polymerase sigma-70 factor [Capillimicrobium parvum]